MGQKKKKKHSLVSAEEIAQKKISFLHGDAKRGIAAIFFFLLAALFMLGFFESAGALGEFLDSAIGMLLGWGKWIFPPVLVIAGIFLLERWEGGWVRMMKLVGLSLSFISSLGFFHLFLSGDLLMLAEAGKGGGYIGYSIASLLLSFAGKLAGAIILSALLLIGLVAAFNLSLQRFFNRILSGLKPEETVEVGVETPAVPTESQVQTGTEIPTTPTLVEPVPSPEEQEQKFLEETNIKRIRFVEEKKLTAPIAIPGGQSNISAPEEHFPVGISNKKQRRGASRWELPSVDLLESSEDNAAAADTEKNAEIIKRTLNHFGIEVERGEILAGPTVTQYTFRPALGVKLSRITTLHDNLSLALAAHPIRIEAPIPGKPLIGIEVPNSSSVKVRLKDMLHTPDFARRQSPLTVVLGQDVSGQHVMGDLCSMPHLLIAGATNSGKSVCINALLLSLLYQNSPEQLKLILIDPKRVELPLYNGIPHLVSDVIVENKKVVSALKWAVGEMERRNQLLQEAGSRDLISYQQKVKEGETRMITHPDTGEVREEKLKALPYVVIVIDELAQLMLVHGKEVEPLVVRLASMSRASGIHLVLATQKPLADVITSLIKSNITTRIAFQVFSQMDSRTILDMGGAERLLGRGDMLYLAAGTSQPQRLQGVFISEAEVKRVAEFWRRQKLVEGNEESIGEHILPQGEHSSSHHGAAGDMKNLDDYHETAERDGHYEAAKALIIQMQKASASLLQRRLSVGYARAARLLDILEEDGIIGPADGAKPREVFVPRPEGSTANQNSEKEFENPALELTKRDKWQA